jgi:hypothetical protein
MKIPNNIEMLSTLLFKKKFKTLNYDQSGIVYELAYSQRFRLPLIKVLNTLIKTLNRFKKGLIAKIENKFLRLNL